jgi:hypothetical protein
VDLSVVLPRGVDPDDLRAEAEAVLQELLDLRSGPRIEIRRTAGGGERVEIAGQAWAIEVPGTAEATLLVLDLPHDESAPERTEPTAVVSRGELRTAPSAALAIAVAIALARRAGAPVLDDALLLSGTVESEPSSLLAAVRLEEPQGDLAGAARRLVEARGL